MLKKIYRFYRFKLYPQIQDYRGSTRLLFMIRHLLLRRLDRPAEECIEISDLDWRNLIILDGCRHDSFQEVIEEDSDFRISCGSSSSEFIEKNFSDNDFSDTVLIGGNPFLHPPIFEDLTGHTPKEVFAEIFHTYQDDWDDTSGTIMPDKLVRDAKTAEKLFPEKKKIVWFMQPHFPFVNYDFEEETAGVNPYLGENPDNTEKFVWRKAEKGCLEKKNVIEGYRSNIEFVIPYGKEIAEELKGKTVLTSDHGNLLGESGLFGHPDNCSAIPVRKVPWYEF